MNIPADSSVLLLRVLVELARELPPGTLNSLISALEPGGEGQNLGRFATTQAMRDRLRRLEELRGQHPEIDGPAVALALRAAGEAATAVLAEHQADIAWTGPATEAVPVRRVDQVIYDMVDSARDEVILVTYAAFRADRAVRMLQRAGDRGVYVRLIIEVGKERGGKLDMDGLRAFRTALPGAEILYWPPERRERTATGSYGAMHAKCLIVDKQRALVSSANLTDFALESNMELGVIVGPYLATRLSQHFRNLIVRGELQDISRN